MLEPKSDEDAIRMAAGTDYNYVFRLLLGSRWEFLYAESKKDIHNARIELMGRRIVHEIDLREEKPLCCVEPSN